MVQGSCDASEAFIRYFSTQLLSTGAKILEYFHLRLYSLMEENRSLLCATAAIQSQYEWLFFESLTPAVRYLLEFHAAASLDFICCICNAILFPFKQIDH